MIIASAQTVPSATTTENIHDHLRLAAKAAEHGAQLVLFPEMSLTGYTLEDAEALHFTVVDKRLESLQELASDKGITIVAGAPVKMDGELYIGAIIIEPGKPVSVYTKKFLHGNEKNFFIPGSFHDKPIMVGEQRARMAICADISNPEHAGYAAKTGCDLYLAGIFYTPGGIHEAYEQLPAYAGAYGFHVLMSNYGGPSYNLDAAGRSAFWNSSGNIIGSLKEQGEGLLIVRGFGDEWLYEEAEI